MQTQSINDLSELLGDDGMYPARNGHKRPDSPSFIFRDEQGTEPSDLLWGRDLALDWEEWKAKQEQREQYLLGKLLPAFLVTKSIAKPVKPLTEPLSNKVLDIGRRPSESQRQEWKVRKQVTDWITATEIVLATMDEVEAWMDKPSRDRKPVMVWRDDEGVLQEWQAPTEAETEAFLDRQASREQANWLINWHKKIKNASQELMADCLRKGIAKLADVLDDPEFGPYALATHRAAKEVFKDAPKKIGGVFYINPDGKKVAARPGLSYSTAKEGYKLRHGIEDELVTMDRVQYVDEPTSRYIIGTRKASDKTASSYYDPEPVKGDHGYIPRACTLIRLDPKSPVMPDESCHRLTVRELERAIIAGANLVEDDIEAFADSFDDTDECFDTREGGLSFDNSCNFRTFGDLDEQSQWLYWVLYGAGLEEATQALLVADGGDIGRYLPGLDGACIKLGTDEPLTDDEELAMSLLNSAQEEDCIELEKTGRVQWSRFDLIRSLSQFSFSGESLRYRELVNDAFELNLDVLNNSETRPAYLRW